VPPQREAGGTGLVFGTFAASFFMGGLATWWLPERRGQSLDDVAAAASSLRG